MASISWSEDEFETWTQVAKDAADIVTHPYSPSVQQVLDFAETFRKEARAAQERHHAYLGSPEGKADMKEARKQKDEQRKREE